MDEIKDVMAYVVETIPPEATLTEAVARMKELRVGAVSPVG